MKLMKLMIDVHPRFLQEDWVVANVTPLALYRKPRFCSWMFELRKNPPSLSQLVKSWIFYYMGTYPPHKVKKLQLPDKLKTFLEFTEHFPAKMYRRRTLNSDDCPFDCTSLCLNQQCPEIDISDSGSEFEGSGDEFLESPRPEQ